MKTLLLTSGRNDDKNSSWLVYKKFISLMRSKCKTSISIICFTPSINPKNKELGEKIYSTFLRNKLISAFSNRITRNYGWFIANIYATLYTKRVIRHIQNEGIERLWVHTDILTMLILKRILQSNSTIPFHLTIYDDPFTNKFYMPFQNKTRPIIKELMQQAKSIDTPTHLLAEHYRSKGYINSNCLTAESLVGTFKVIPEIPLINTKVKYIALAGSIYGLDALSSFFEALESLFEEKLIEFHLRTNVPRLYLSYIKKNYPVIARNIIIKPFINENELSRKLHEYDLLYLPMMFDENYRFKTNTSFPSKTHNYLASGIPIIVHAPSSSSLYQFFNKKEIGHLIDSNELEKIKKSFEQLLDVNYREKLSFNIKNFNLDHQKNEHVIKLYDTITS